MKPTRLLLASSLAIALVSCATQKTNYDTSPPTAAQPPVAATTPSQVANPTYDTPAAYEDSSAAPVNPDAVVPPTPTTPGKPATAAAPHGASPVAATHAATVHVVVARDTLGGIARKYQVTAAAIKKANNMTNDIVVLGKKLIIPAN
ncbi:MAG: LysM peptidoglycan-binding domain-containing protein [Verrucomicrobiota bacterium]